MTPRFIVLAVAGVFSLLFTCAQNGWSEEKVLRMSTTTSTQSSGLLDILLPAFEQESGIRIKVIAKGTGAAIRDGEDGNVDIIFVHAKEREIAFVNKGLGTERYPVMHNDFILIGPQQDPAGIKTTTGISKALNKIARTKSLFISRGDDSGTHTKEQALWAASGVPLAEKTLTIIKKGKKRAISFHYPAHAENWYISIGQGMGKVLTYADEKQAYTLTDRGTYIKFKYGKTPALELDILSQGDKNLRNPYGIIPVSPQKYPHVNYSMAMEFVHWITGQQGQKLIGEYRLEGKQLFYPDVIK